MSTWIQNNQGYAIALAALGLLTIVGGFMALTGSDDTTEAVGDIAQAANPAALTVPAVADSLTKTVPTETDPTGTTPEAVTVNQIAGAAPNLVPPTLAAGSAAQVVTPNLVTSVVVTEAPLVTEPPPTTAPPATAAPAPTTAPPATAAPAPTTAPPATAAPAPAPSGGPTAAQWAALRECEASGSYTISNPNGLYHGAYQFSQSTWDGVAKGAGRTDLVGVKPSNVSPADQDALALALYQDRGAQPWPHCGAHLR